MIGTNNIIVTQNKNMRDILEKALAVSYTKANVLLLGESGTGKEILAKYIHDNSYRSAKEMVAVNCAALPETLFESELFGFEKGSFTGSIASKIGKFEKSSGSTILLDEISEMNYHLQAKLLRVTQESEIDRIGSLDTIGLDLRIIATSNKNLLEEVKKGRFRHDLYYRLSVVVFEVPPLRDRVEDIEPLIKHFVSIFNEKYLKNIEFIDNEVVSILQNHSFPGNIRELKNIIERGVLFSKSNRLQLKDIQLEYVRAVSPSDNILKRNEKETILKVLTLCGENRIRAAEKLGISVRTLRNKLKEYREEKAI